MFLSYQSRETKSNPLQGETTPRKTIYALTSYNYYYLFKVTLCAQSKLSASSVCRMKHTVQQMGKICHECGFFKIC